MLQVVDTFQFIHQQYQAIMHIIPSDQNPSLLLRSKVGEVPRQEEEPEFDFRQYRYLLFVFADNLNRSLKVHRDCLGEMEYHPKFRISKDEQENYEESLPVIFQKYSAKLLKESVYRNTLIRKTCESYLEQFGRVFPGIVETEPTVAKRNPASLGFLRKMTITDGKKTPILSARNQSRKTVSTSACAQDKLMVLSQTFKAFQADLSMTLKLKTISSDNPESKECFLRATRSTITRNERMRLKSDHYPMMQKKKTSMGDRSHDGIEEMCFKGNQILISEQRKTGDEEWEYQREAPFHSKFCTKRVVAIGQSQKKAINDIEKLHMQTKNIEIAGVFWAPMGDLNHRPKLKRWQHSFS